jgi:6-phosphogluconate dehydrogenase
MGGNIARRLIRHGHQAVVFDQDRAAATALAQEGAVAATGLQDLVRKLDKPRAVWVMLPSGDITEGTIYEIGVLLQADDVVIDGGNTFWKDDIRRAAALRPRGVHYIDVGTSGGVWGLERGENRVEAGDDVLVAADHHAVAALAPGEGDMKASPGRDGRDPRVQRGYIHAGPNGAGHFVKMVHNGIEYGLMQAYAEGFDILKNAGATMLPAAERFDLDLADVAEVWRRGSVITSWLLDLTAAALAQDPALTNFSGFVQDSGEGRWTLQAAIDEAVPAEVLAAALFTRFRSRQDHTFAEKVLSAMRKGFGGHVEPKET